MPLIGHLLRSLAWRAATDPRVRAGAAQAARNLKPKAKAAASAIREAAREAPPQRITARFVAALLDRGPGPREGG